MFNTQSASLYFLIYSQSISDGCSSSYLPSSSLLSCCPFFAWGLVGAWDAITTLLGTAGQGRSRHRLSFGGVAAIEEVLVLERETSGVVGVRLGRSLL